MIALINEVSELRRTSSQLHQETLVQKSQQKESESETSEIIGMTTWSTQFSFCFKEFWIYSR